MLLENNQKSRQPVKLTAAHIELAAQIAHRLNRRYGWIGLDDLQSYAYMGIMLASRMYDEDRGISFERFACVKAMYLAIDEMRKDGVLQRSDATLKKHAETMGVEIEMPDPGSSRAEEIFEAREFCNALLQRIAKPERELLARIYVQKQTYREISRLYDISESAVCLRHKAVIEKIRRMATVRKLAA